MYTVTGKPTEEMVEKYSKDNSIFFRFQNPAWELTKNSKSWGMTYGSEEEARECAEEFGLTEEEAVLPGKSCMDTLEGVWNWVDQFDWDNDVVLVFEGTDTGVSGHDDEWVAEFIRPVAVWKIEDVYNYLKSVGSGVVC